MQGPAIDALSPANGERFVDATYGGGGHARAILAAADVRLLAIDRDPAAHARACDHARCEPRLTAARGRYARLDAIAAEHGFLPADGILIDTGVSSFQLDEAERGFSFRLAGPLDMRMQSEGVTAADVVNRLDEQDLAAIFRFLGEEPAARRLAGAIVRRRASAPFSTTRELAGLAQQQLGSHRTRHPATRMFLALRIFVNDELRELRDALAAAERTLRPGGRLVLITFHSLEDRIVKNFLFARAGLAARPSRHQPVVEEECLPSFELPRRRPRVPDAAEIGDNPRARSARLRWALRSDAPVWTGGPATPLPRLPRLSDLERCAA